MSKEENMCEYSLQHLAEKAKTVVNLLKGEEYRDIQFDAAENWCIIFTYIHSENLLKGTKNLVKETKTLNRWTKVIGVTAVVMVLWTIAQIVLSFVWS